MVWYHPGTKRISNSVNGNNCHFHVQLSWNEQISVLWKLIISQVVSCPFPVIIYFMQGAIGHITKHQTAFAVHSCYFKWFCINQIGFQSNQVTCDGKRLVWSAQRIKDGYKGKGWATYMFERCLEFSLQTHTGVETTTASKDFSSAQQEALKKGNVYGNRLVWAWVGY